MRDLALALVAGSAFLLTGCGDTYRPIAIPIVQPGGDPQTLSLAAVVSNNNGGPGGATSVDVTGDTNVANFSVGNDPVHAAFWVGTTSRVYVVNRGADAVSYYAPSATGGTVSTIGLPTGSRPVFISAGSTSFVYVAESGTNNLAIIDAGLGALAKELPVGVNPVAVGQTPDGNWVYVANKGSGTVSVINAATQTIDTTITVGSSPMWVTVRNDSSTVYVLNQASATISVIDVGNQALVATVPTGPSPSMIAFDNANKRLYVSNTGSNTVSVYNADLQVPTLMATVTVGAGPTSVAPLADGSRFYVTNAGCTDPINLTGCTGKTVSVVDALSFSVRKTLTVGSTPIWAAATTDSTKVVVANRDSDNISDIRTLDDTVVATINASAPRPVFVVVNSR